jgi:hypothetical protein
VKDARTSIRITWGAPGKSQKKHKHRRLTPHSARTICPGRSDVKPTLRKSRLEPSRFKLEFF